MANNVLASLDRECMVNNFVAAYVNEYDRKGILGGPWRYRELADTIGREIVLSTVVEVRELLPAFFGKKLRDSLKAEEKEAIEAFLREMIAALGHAWNWNTEDRREFRRDLGLYADFAMRHALQQKRKITKRHQEESPFVARVALLLDASLLEQARRAAGEFYPKVGTFAQKVLRLTLRPSRT